MLLSIYWWTIFSTYWCYRISSTRMTRSERTHIIDFSVNYRSTIISCLMLFHILHCISRRSRCWCNCWCLSYCWRGMNSLCRHRIRWSTSSKNKKRTYTSDKYYFFHYVKFTQIKTFESILLYHSSYHRWGFFLLFWKIGERNQQHHFDWLVYWCRFLIFGNLEYLVLQ